MSAIDDLRADTATPFEQARAMPRPVDTKPAFLEAELSISLLKANFVEAGPKRYQIQEII